MLAAETSYCVNIADSPVSVLSELRMCVRLRQGNKGYGLICAWALQVNHLNDFAYSHNVDFSPSARALM